MKKLPQLLAFFFILVTFFRVSSFLSTDLKFGAYGYFMAFAVTVGVFLGGYFTSKPDISKLGRFWAILALVLFGVVDWYYNYLEVVHSLAPETLISKGANFLNMNDAYITYMMQWAAVLYATVPTVGAGLLGLLQSQVEKIASLNKRGWVAASVMAISATLTKGIKATLEDKYQIGKYAQIGSGNSGKQLTDSNEDAIDGSILPDKVRWEDLLATDKEAIAAMNGKQIIAKWQVSPRTARNWKSWVISGKK